jgi:Omp85 superfamily domain/Surface antigen variable number repeat
MILMVRPAALRIATRRHGERRPDAFPQPTVASACPARRRRTRKRAGKRAVVFLIVFCFAGASGADVLRIGTIAIRGLDVYSESEAERGAFYRATDRLHVETRPAVIRGFLLFREGDPYDAARLEETERNLRALGFLKSASVTAGEPHDGVVDVTVTTQDAWSLEPGTEAGNKGGVSTFGVRLTDSNIAGFGRQLSLIFDKGTDRSRTAIDYSDPAFIRPYWKSRLTYAQNSDGFERRVAVGRPFYSFSTPWATELSFEDVQRSDRLFSDGMMSEKFRQQHRQIVADYGMALDPNERRATRLTAGFRFINDDFFNLRRRRGDALPGNRAFRYLFVRFDRVDNDYLKLNFVDQDMRYEDFNLGQQLTLEAALSPKALGAPATTAFVRVGEARGWRIDPTSFLLPSISFEGRLDHGLQNGVLSANVRYVRRFETAFPQATVGRVAINNGWNLDGDQQFFADGGTGLRGYSLHAFEGSRSLIVNLEQRLYLGRELLQLVSPGVVAFVDAGRATNGSLLNAPGFKSDAGVGLRIGLPRTPKNLLRIDVAYPLQRDPLRRKGPLISFSSGQAF